MSFNESAGAASSIAGPVLQVAGMINQGASNRKQRRHERQLNERNIQAQIDMWNQNNAYNTPAMQRKRLEAAGMNPMQMQSGGAVQNTSSAVNLPEAKPQSKDETGQAMMDFGQSLQGTALNFQNLDFHKKQMEVMDTEIALKAAQIASLSVKDENVTGRTARDKVGLERDTVGLDRDKVGLDSDMNRGHLQAIALDSAYKTQAAANQTVFEKLKAYQLDNERRSLENRLVNPRHKMALQQSAARLKESSSNLKGAALERALKNEALELRKAGLTESDEVILRYLVKTLGIEL